MKLINQFRMWVNRHETLCSFLVIALVGFMAFIPSMKGSGFYGDDYHMVYGAYTSGPEKIFDSYMIDRPGAGLTLWGLYEVFGPNIHLYQALVILLDIVTALCVLWSIRAIWPGQKAIAFSIAILTVIYPGFTNMMESFNYSLMLISVSFYFISIALTIRVLKSTRLFAKIFMTILSALLAFWSVFIMEYYLALEILRIGVIFLILNHQNPNLRKIKVFTKTLFAYLPYLLVIGGFVVWRFFFFTNQRNATELGVYIGSLWSSPVYKLLSIIADLFKNLLKITVLAWFDPLYQVITDLRLKDFLAFMVIALFGALLVYSFYKVRDPKSGEVESDKKEMIQISVLGLITVIGTSLPIVLVNREVTFADYSRYSLTGMVGGILILAAFIHFFVKSGFRPFLISFLVFSGILTQLGSARELIADWQGSKDLWWQLSWRAPSIKPDTLLTGNDVNYNIVEGFNLWGPANMIYYPAEKNPVITAETLNPEFIKAIQISKDPQRDFRTYMLNMETGNLLVLSVPSDVSCLHLINGAAADYSTYDSSTIQLVGQYSRLDQVDVAAVPISPPTYIFGTEPAHGWCYFYQKAELALQRSDYAEVARLREEVEGKGLRPNDQIELLPFILAYAQLDDMEMLTELLPMFLDDPYHKVSYCVNLSEGNYNISGSSHQLLIELSCKN